MSLVACAGLASSCYGETTASQPPTFSDPGIEPTVVTRAEHQQFTNAWRQAIPHGPSGTGMATRAQVEAAARQIYADYPQILRALGLG